jgi:integrase
MLMRRSKRPARTRMLTELTVRKAKPERTAYLLWDLRQHGLALRVQPTGHRAWVVVYRFHGRPRWYHIGDGSSIALSDARKLAARIALAVAEGQDPGAAKRAERGAGTFADLAARYVETYAKRHNKSWAQPDRLVRRYVLPRWGALQASGIVRADVKALMASIEAPVLGNQVLAAVSAIFSWAMKEEILAGNPCKLVERHAVASRERILSESELPRFWSAFDTAGTTVAAALKTLLLVGQRPGECTRMRFEHIKDGWWEMPGKPVPELGWPGTKNGASHRVWLPAAVREIIAALGDSRTEGFVFAGVERLDAAMRDICAKLKVERATPHDLRRTHGSTITALGFGRDAMNRVQNHVEGGIASVYDRHGYTQENRRVMEAVAARIMALVEGAPSGKVVPIRR